MEKNILFLSGLFAALFFVCSGFLSVALSAENLVVNPSLEVDGGTGVPADWVQEIAGSNDAVFSYLDSGAQDGTRSVKITMTWRTSGSADLAPAAPVSVVPGRAYYFENYYQSSVETETDVEFQDAEGNLSWRWLGNNPASADWKLASYSFEIPAGAVKARVYQALAAPGYLQTDNYSFSVLEETAFSRGMVSITFDDGFANVYNNALPILDQYGFKTTQYIVSGAIGSQTKLDLPTMTRSQIAAMCAAGHEIGSHTVTHPRLTSLNAKKLNSELSSSKNALNAICAPVSSLAIPYGDYNDNVINAAKKYYGSVRTSDGGENTLIGFDPHRIKTQYVMDTTTIDEIETWLARAAANKSWLVLLYHNVGSEYNYGYTAAVEDFDRQMAAVAASGLPVLTVGQALAEITPQLH
ncbi:MAG: polysaccharide deacetylase family protein [Minisyncoccales bacterium]